MKFLIMGVGSIGERHAKNLKSMLTDVSIDAYDPSSERLTEVCKRNNVRPVDNGAVDRAYDCVLVCTPPISHIELALRALHAGSNVFIEKPLSSDLKNVDKLSLLSEEKGLLAFVAYNFRFNRGLSLVRKMASEQAWGKVIHATAYFGQYLPDWRPWQDYKKSYTANKSMGGGIIFDGSHEVDYVAWMFGRPTYVQSNFASTNTLSADTEAITDILLTFKDMPAYIHLDFIRREYRRVVELLCEKGIIYWSLSEDVVKTFDASTKQWNTVSLNENVNDMYLSEISHVLDCINSHKKSEVIGLENGISTLQLSDAIYKSGLTGHRVSI